MSTLHSPKILFVEDSLIVALAVSRKLAAFGFRVFQANNGQEAVRIAQQHGDFDLLMMDIDLGPGMDGIQAAREIIHQRELPVVFVSSHNDPDIINLANTLPHSKFLAKGAADASLRSTLELAMSEFCRQSQH